MSIKNYQEQIEKEKQIEIEELEIKKLKVELIHEIMNLLKSL